MRAGCLQRNGLGAVEGLVFGLQLGSLIPLIPPFYCQLFPSYRRSRTEFRICATVHRSILRPTDAALLFLSLHQYRRRPAHHTPSTPCSRSTVAPPHRNHRHRVHTMSKAIFISPSVPVPTALSGRETGSIGECSARRENHRSMTLYTGRWGLGEENRGKKSKKS